MTKNKFTHIQTFDEYVDFNKELFSLPDDGNTSIDMRLTFNTRTLTCYYTIITHNDSGNIFAWECDHKIPWIVGLGLLDADGIELPKELTDDPETETGEDLDQFYGPSARV